MKVPSKSATSRSKTPREALSLYLNPQVAISCWNLEFRPEDHKFLQDSQVFSHIHRLLTSASRRESPTPLPTFNRSVEIPDVELTVSSRDSVIPYLHDKKTDTFWESGSRGVFRGYCTRLSLLIYHSFIISLAKLICSNGTFEDQNGKLRLSMY